MPHREPSCELLENLRERCQTGLISWEAADHHVEGLWPELADLIKPWLRRLPKNGPRNTTTLEKLKE